MPYEPESLAEYLLAIAVCDNEDPHGVHQTENEGICLGKQGLIAPAGWSRPIPEEVPQPRLEIQSNA